MLLTASDGGAAAPLPAGRATPGPAPKLDEIPPGALLPRRALGSAGGSDSTERDTICAPRTIVRPSVLFSSVSMVWLAEPLAPGAAGLFCLRLTRRNSSVSARTRFICCTKVSKVQQYRYSSKSDLVECQHLTRHLAAVVQSHSHPVVDLAQTSVLVARHRVPAMNGFSCVYVRIRPVERAHHVSPECQCRASG